MRIMMMMVRMMKKKRMMITMVVLSAVQGPGASDNMLNCAIMLEVKKPKTLILSIKLDCDP